MTLAFDYLANGGALRRWKRPNRGVGAYNHLDESTFFPTRGPRTALVTWNPATMLIAGDVWDATAQRLSMMTANTTYAGIDFGTVEIKPRAANCRIADCSFVNTRETATHASIRNNIDCRDDLCVGLIIEYCDLGNASKYSPGFNNMFGDQFTLRHSRLWGGADSIKPTGAAGVNSNILIEDNWFGPMAWWASPVTNVVHPSDSVSHNDILQFSDVLNITIQRNSMRATLSTTVGTGLPGTGNDTGVVSADYTQAQGEQFRAGVGSLGVNASSLSTIMIANGTVNQQMKLLDNHFGGGGYSLNAPSLTNATPGTLDGTEIKRNKVWRDQRLTGSAFRIRAATAVDFPTSGIDANVWKDDGSVVVRLNT